jgi:alpha-tubulin suppressor-like RCC1 family protein
MEQAEHEWRTDPCVISAGAWFSLVIGKDGNTYSLGDNLMGQCGGEKTEHATPEIISGLPKSQVRMVSAGEQHSMFVLANGDVYGCGSNEFGQLGLGDVAEAHTPGKIHAFADLRIKRAAAGGYHTVFLGFDGSVWSVGCNDHDSLDRVRFPPITASLGWSK